MAKPLNYTVGARQSSRMSYVCYKKEKKNQKFRRFFLIFFPFLQHMEHLCMRVDLLSNTQKMALLKFQALLGMFIEWKNITKSLSGISQHFLCQFDEGITKTCKNLTHTMAFYGKKVSPKGLDWLCDMQVAYKVAQISISISCPLYFCYPFIK